jgi:hypothetical protein
LAAGAIKRVKSGSENLRELRELSTLVAQSSQSSESFLIKNSLLRAPRGEISLPESNLDSLLEMAHLPLGKSKLAEKLLHVPVAPTDQREDRVNIVFISRQVKVLDHLGRNPCRR